MEVPRGNAVQPQAQAGEHIQGKQEAEAGGSIIH